MSYTKGPWIATATPDLSLFVCVGEEHDIVAEVQTCNVDDLHLIAAAPELLEALKAIVVDDTWGLDHPTYMKCRAAIIKAEGNLQ